MKRIFIILTILACSYIAKAQDIIITRDGERIDAVVEEVSDTQIKYKRKDNINGPVFVLGTDKIASIIYKNGSVQAFEQTTTPPPPVITDGDDNEWIEKTSTPAEGPWLLWGVQAKEGVNMYFFDPYSYEYKTAFGVRCIPSIEGYVEFTPKQEDMAEKRHSIYLGLQYTFRGAMKCHNVYNEPKLDLQYLCFRPAYSLERKVFYSHTGFELGILTYSTTKYSNGERYNERANCNKVTIGMWEEFGWVIKDHFNIGLSFDYIMTSSTKDTWVDHDTGKHLSGYSPQLQLQLVFGYKFNPYKFDKKKVEPIL